MEEEQDEEQPEDNDNEENAPEEGEQDQKAGEVLFKSEEGEGEQEALAEAKAEWKHTKWVPNKSKYSQIYVQKWSLYISILIKV